MPGSGFAIGIAAFGPANITNTGKIITGDGDPTFFTPVYGIRAFEDGAVIQNSGSISVGAIGRGITAGGDNSSILNSGTILGGAGSTGIEVQPPISGPAAAAGIAITNTSTGSIIVGPGSIGINFEDSGTLINQGLIRAIGLGSESLNTCGCSIAAVTNFGTLDGQVFLGAGSSLINSGLLTVTDSDAANPVGGFAHLFGETYLQTLSGTLALRVTGDGRNDALAGSTGTSTATLSGGLRALVQPGLYANSTTYLNVVTTGSGGVNGQFGTVTTSSAFFTATATYNSQSVDLNLSRTAFGSVPGSTRNQMAVGNAFETGYSPSLDPTSVAGQFYANLLAAASIGVLDNLSGEGTAALQNASIGAGSQFNNATLGQLVFGDTSGTTSIIIPPPQYAATPKPRGADAFASVLKAPPGRWRLWPAGLGGYRSIDGNAFPIGSANQTIRNYGGAFGFDYQAASDLLVGFAAGGSEANVSVPDRSTTGRLTGGHFGVYGLKTWGAAYLAASANYARFDNSTTRTIAGVGPTENAAGNFASDQLSARLELGWKRAFANYTLTPFVAIEPAALWSHGYTETSTTVGGAPGVLGLSFAARTTTSLPTFLGVQADTRIAFANGAVVSPYARASWVHEFEPSRQITATFVSLPTGAFTVDGARPARDSGRLDAGFKVQLDTTRSLFANVSGEWSGISQSYSATAGLKVALQ